MKATKVLLAAMGLYMVFVLGMTRIGYGENSHIDSNGQKTIIVRDSTNTSNVELRGDATLHALYVSGLGAAACGTTHVDKQALAANATATITAPATSTSFMIQTESSNTDVVYMLPSTTIPTALTGIELLPSDSVDGDVRLTAISVKNGSASAAATVTIFWCY